MSFKPTLSEDPKALVGAAEWAQKEIEKLERENEAAQVVYERIKPLRQEAFRKIHERENGMTVKV